MNMALRFAKRGQSCKRNCLASNRNQGSGILTSLNNDSGGHQDSVNFVACTGVDFPSPHQYISNDAEPTPPAQWIREVFCDDNLPIDFMLLRSKLLLY